MVTDYSFTNPSSSGGQQLHGDGTFSFDLPFRNESRTLSEGQNAPPPAIGQAATICSAEVKPDEQIFLFANARKRRPQEQQSDEPQRKRRVDRVSARLENFHITNDTEPLIDDPDDRFSDDSSEDNNGSEESTEEDKRLVILEEQLRNYIKRTHEATPIISNPLSLAVVPYVPPPTLFDNPAMIGRINEIDAEDAKNYASNDKGVVTFPEEAHLESTNCMDECIEHSNEFGFSEMNDAEIDSSHQDYMDMEIDG